MFGLFLCNHINVSMKLVENIHVSLSALVLCDLLCS